MRTAFIKFLLMSTFALAQGFDLIIRNARVIDGTGAPDFVAKFSNRNNTDKKSDAWLEC